MDVRVAGRLAAAFFAPVRAAIFGALFRFAVVVFAAGRALLFLRAAPALLLLRVAVPFDAAVDLRRDFPPDDFDLVAIIEFLEGRYRTLLRKIRAQCRVRGHRDNSRVREHSRDGAVNSHRPRRLASQNHWLVADCNRASWVDSWLTGAAERPK